MNKFNQLLLGSTALTFISLAPANAVTINETTDFSDNFAGRQIIGAQASGAGFLATTIFGQMNSLPDALPAASGEILDGLDYFRLTGLAANQSVTINLRPVA